MTIREQFDMTEVARHGDGNIKTATQSVRSRG
jgi:hypothetical protein